MTATTWRNDGHQHKLQFGTSGSKHQDKTLDDDGCTDPSLLLNASSDLYPITTENTLNENIKKEACFYLELTEDSFARRLYTRSITIQLEFERFQRRFRVRKPGNEAVQRSVVVGK